MSEDVIQVGVYVKIEDANLEFFWDNEEETLDLGFGYAGRKSEYTLIYKTLVNDYAYDFSEYFYSQDEIEVLENDIFEFCQKWGLTPLDDKSKLFFVKWYNGGDHPLNYL